MTNATQRKEKRLSSQRDMFCDLRGGWIVMELGSTVVVVREGVSSMFGFGDRCVLYGEEGIYKDGRIPAD